MSKIIKEKEEAQKLPSHIVLLPDGNRRWARERNLPTIRGHLAGYENIKRFCTWCQEKEIKVMTAFGFSSENWSRPKNEVKYLMHLLEKGLVEEMENYRKGKSGNLLFNNRVKVRIIGQREKLPLSLRKVIDRIENLTKNNKDSVLNLAISYSGRWDIIQAIKKIIKSKIPTQKINEELFNGYLSTSNLPSPDLIIRTSGVERLSNFLLWQSAYSELYFSNKYWPDFNKSDFNNALKEYNKRQRRFGH